MSNVRDTSVRYPGGTRAWYGVAAYVIGYLIVYLLTAWRSESILQRVAHTDGGSLATVLASADISFAGWEVAFWLFYGAHGVDLIVPSGGGSLARINLVWHVGGWYLLLYCLPPTLLVLAGILVTRDRPTADTLPFDLGTETRRYAYNGGLIVFLGYGPIALFGVAIPATGSLNLSYPPIVFAYVAGVYPLLFGGMGGVIGRTLTRGDSDSGDVEWKETG